MTETEKNNPQPGTEAELSEESTAPEPRLGKEALLEAPIEVPQALQILSKLLIVGTVVVIGIAAWINLDILPATLLGCGIVGINFYWTRHFFRKILAQKNIGRRSLVFFLLKFGVSVLVLYVAIIEVKISGLGLLLGLSNIVVAITLYTVLQTLIPTLGNK